MLAEMSIFASPIRCNSIAVLTST